MNIEIRIECECKSFADIPVTLSNYSNDKLDFTESIEQNSNGLFYCSQNYVDGMGINCVMCGKGVKVFY